MSEVTLPPCPANIQNLIGQQFGLLTVRGFSGRRRQRAVWRCECVCGTMKDVCAGDLKSGHAQSCGCSTRSLLSKKSSAAARENAANIIAERVHPDGRVQLANGSVCLFDPSDCPLVSQHVWIAIRSHRTTYARARTADGYVFLHNLLMGKRNGFRVDHRNGNGLDNRRENLRWATGDQNAQNSHKAPNSKSGYRGVQQGTRSKKWEANISAGGVRHRLGYFATAEEAARVYDDAAKRFHGEFARLNFPEAT